MSVVQRKGASSCLRSGMGDQGAQGQTWTRSTPTRGRVEGLGRGDGEEEAVPVPGPLLGPEGTGYSDASADVVSEMEEVNEPLGDSDGDGLVMVTGSIAADVDREAVGEDVPVLDRAAVVDADCDTDKIDVESVGDADCVRDAD